VVEGEEAGEHFVAGEVGGPAAAGEDSFVEGAVGVGEPRSDVRCRGGSESGS
jgi:hypothetical protein